MYRRLVHHVGPAITGHASKFKLPTCLHAHTLGGLLRKLLSTCRVPEHHVLLGLGRMPPYKMVSHVRMLGAKVPVGARLHVHDAATPLLYC